MSDCKLQLVREDGKLFVHCCPECKREVRSKYRDPAMRKQTCGVQGVMIAGPGTEFRRITRELRVNENEGCDCAKLEREMNAAGIEGCRARRAEFIDRIKANAKRYRLADFAAAGWQAVIQGKPWTIEGLYDLAISRASQSFQASG